MPPTDMAAWALKSQDCSSCDLLFLVLASHPVSNHRAEIHHQGVQMFPHRAHPCGKCKSIACTSHLLALGTLRPNPWLTWDPAPSPTCCPSYTPPQDLAHDPFCVPGYGCGLGDTLRRLPQEASPTLQMGTLRLQPCSPHKSLLPECGLGSSSQQLGDFPDTNIPSGPLTHLTANKLESGGYYQCGCKSNYLLEVSLKGVFLGGICYSHQKVR